MSDLTNDERHVLHALTLRPNGAPFRSPELKNAVVSLSERQLVCDPHRMGEALFTRITTEGKAALVTGEPLAGF